MRSRWPRSRGPWPTRTRRTTRSGVDRLLPPVAQRPGPVRGDGLHRAAGVDRMEPAVPDGLRDRAEPRGCRVLPTAVRGDTGARYPAVGYAVALRDAARARHQSQRVGQPQYRAVRQVRPHVLHRVWRPGRPVADLQRDRLDHQTPVHLGRRDRGALRGRPRSGLLSGRASPVRCLRHRDARPAPAGPRCADGLHADHADHLPPHLPPGRRRRDPGEEPAQPLLR